MENHRIFTKTWFRVVGLCLLFGAILLATFINLPASAEPPAPAATPFVEADEGDRELIHTIDVKPLEEQAGALTPPPCDLSA